MLKSTFTLDPSPLLFDVSTISGDELPARIERVALEHIELAANPRRADQRRGHRPARQDALRKRPARAVHRLASRPRPAQGDPVRRPASLPRRPGQPRPRRQRVHATAWPSRSAA